MKGRCVMEMVSIHTEYIQLDQLLKWVGLTSTGGQVAAFVENEAVKINGAVCHEKRKKIYPGDEVEVRDCGVYKIVAE